MNAPCMYVGSSWLESWFPGYSDELFAEGQEKYKSLLQAMIAGGNKKVLSFDDYAFDDDEVGTGIEKFLASMDSVRTNAGTDMPFWGFVQAGNVGYRVPTQAMTDWQVNVMLAFGAKGVEYFPMAQSTITVEETDYTDNGLFDVSGNKTDYYTQVTNANKQVQAVDGVLMNAENAGIIALGTDAREYISNLEVCLNETESATSYGSVQSITTDDATGGALIGCFEYRGMEAYYVVNYNYEGSENQTVTLNFDNLYRYHIIDAEMNVAGTDSLCTLSIAPGKAILVVVDSLAGDADGTDSLSAVDLVRYKKMVDETDAYDDVYFALDYVADLNGDDSIDIQDAQWTRYILIGLPRDKWATN